MNNCDLPVHFNPTKILTVQPDGKTLTKTVQQRRFQMMVRIGKQWILMYEINHYIRFILVLIIIQL